eukprot:scaffold7085_cov120-Isochrysis_galbana.AAC.3
MPTPALPQHLVGLVDPASRSWIAPGLQAAAWIAENRYALQQVLSVLPEEDWPDQMTQVLQSRWTLNHRGRLALCTFLWGNGIDPDNIRKVLAPLIKRGREKDVEGILASLKSGSYDSKWFFFSTRYQIRLKLNGEVAEKLNDYTRLQIANYAWEMHMHKFGYGSTLAFQKRFYAEYGIDPVPGY